MTNLGLRSESKEKNYNKMENMWSYLSGTTVSFPKLNKMERSDIESSTRMQLVTSLNIFSYRMIIQSKTVFYGQKKLLCSP